MIRSHSIMTGAAAVLLALASCGPTTDDAEISVRTSETVEDGDTTIVVQTPPDTVIQQRTDTVVQEGVIVERQTDTIVRTVPGTAIIVSEEEKQLIDRWLAANAATLNEYGDPKDMVYTGGTPLYDEATGRQLTKYEYIVMKHPDKPWRKLNSPTQSRPRR